MVNDSPTHGRSSRSTIYRFVYLYFIVEMTINSITSCTEWRHPFVRRIMTRGFNPWINICISLSQPVEVSRLTYPVWEGETTNMLPPRLVRHKRDVCPFRVSFFPPSLVSCLRSRTGNLKISLLSEEDRPSSLSPSSLFGSYNTLPKGKSIFVLWNLLLKGEKVVRSPKTRETSNPNGWFDSSWFSHW